MFFSKELDDMELMEFEERIHYLEANFVRPAPLWIASTGNLRFRRYSRDLRRLIGRFLDERRNTNAPISDILSHVLQLERAGIKSEELVDELLSILFGATALSMSLTWALH